MSLVGPDSALSLDPSRTPKPPEIQIPFEIGALNELAGKLGSLVRSSQLLPTSEIEAASDEATILAAIRNSVVTVQTALSITRLLNQIGAPVQDRDREIASELLPIVLYDIARRESEGRPVSPVELRLFRICRASHGLAPIPGWFDESKRCLELIGQSTELPTAEIYMPHSRTLSAEWSSRGADKFLKIQQQANAFRGVNSGSDQAEIAASKLDVERKKLEGMILRANDVDFLSVPKIRDGLKVNADLPLALGVRTLQLFLDISEAIARLAVPTTTTATTGTFELRPFELLHNQTPSATTANSTPAPLNIASCNLSGEQLLGTAEPKRVLGVLIASYLELRSALIEIETSLAATPRSGTSIRLDALRDLREALEYPFPGGAKRWREILHALNKLPDPEVQSQIPKILCLKTIARDGAAKSYVDLRENIEFLGMAVMQIIHGDSEAVQWIDRALSGTPAMSVAVFEKKVRTALASSDAHTAVATVFETELERLSRETSSGSYTEAAVVLHALSVVPEIPTIGRGLCGRIPNVQEKIGKLVDLLQKTSQSSQSSEFIEKARRRITSYLLPTLDSYFGQQIAVENVRYIMERWQLLLKNKSSWAGIPPGEVFFNGIVISGPPGGGKSYFAICAANSYGLELTRISREEMVGSLPQASSPTVPGRDGLAREGREGTVQRDRNRTEAEEETAFKEFIDRKIERARESMKKSGAWAHVFLIDEMEEEFRRRDPATTTRADRSRTNIMLRVIEKMMQDYPEILWWGTTNDVNGIEPAATRHGRFGLHIEIPLPKREDVEAIVKGTLDARWGEVVSEKFLKHPRVGEFIDTCIDLTPGKIETIINEFIAVRRDESQERGRSGETWREIDDSFMDELGVHTSLVKRITSFADRGQAPNL